MANAALIIGEPGSGKSTAIRTLDSKTTFIIDVAGKGLTFKGWRSLYRPFNSKTKEGNYAITSKVEHIVPLMNMISREMPHIKTIVVDDTNYVSGFKLMSKIHEKGYEKFNEIANDVFELMTTSQKLRDDIIVFYLNHPEVSENFEGQRRIKPKTAGKMIDAQIEIAGLFKICLFAKARRDSDSNRYFFETQSDGATCSKSPMGLFDEFEIPNDLELVRSKMIEYDE